MEDGGQIRMNRSDNWLSVCVSLANNYINFTRVGKDGFVFVCVIWRV